MRFLHILIFALICLASIRAEAKTFNAQSYYLDNGLQVVLIENHRAPVVSHMVWYKFGAADEKPGVSGIAHFLEHLMFKGTPKVPDGAFSATVKKLGGNDNAFTSQDYTAYYQNVSRDALPKVMEMEADRMKNLTLRENEVASERQVIIEERRQRIDNQPMAKFQEQLMSILFVNSPYSIPVIGWLSEMQELTRDQALENYRTWYAPNNAVLVVSGDVTMKELKPLVDKYYADLPVSEIPVRIRPRPAPIIAHTRMIMEDPRVGQPVVTKVYRAPKGSDGMDILAEILGGTSTARLYKHLVVDQKIATSASADYDPISFDDTTFTISVSPVARVSAAQVESAIDREIDLMLQKGITLEELNGAKSRKLASYTYYLDSLQGPALLFGRAIASGFDVNYLENRADRINNLSIDDIQKAAEQLFRPDNIAITGLLTQPQKPVVPSEDKPAKKGGAK